jgi:transcriptional regulator with XRE-family HTH domain
MNSSKETRKDFGSRLELYLKSKNISQDELAILSGVTRQTINNIVNGKTPASSDLLIKMAKSYDDLNINWLLCGQGKMVYEDVQDEKYDPRREYTSESLLELLDSKEETITSLTSRIEELKETITRQNELIDLLKNEGC